MMDLSLAEIFLFLLAVALFSLVFWLFYRLKKAEEHLVELMSISEKQFSYGVTQTYKEYKDTEKKKEEL